LHALFGVGNFTKVVRVCADRLWSGRYCRKSEKHCCRHNGKNLHIYRNFKFWRSSTRGSIYFCKLLFVSELIVNDVFGHFLSPKNYVHVAWIIKTNYITLSWVLIFSRDLLRSSLCTITHSPARR
jgi:hypothetical protein